MSQKQRKTSPNSTFFSIPNPNPLLRAFDIPEPIILPPGVDPYSFLKPNPHGNGGLQSQTPVPLDVDPSVASRTEIVAMTADLTESELAGGTFSDGTTVVATSDSPANSGVVVNDMVAKKFENTQTTVCDVCNVTCNSNDAFKMHMEGKKHSKNMQKLTKKETINATLDQDSEKNTKSDLLQDKPLVDSVVVYNVPGLGTNNQNENQVPDAPLGRDILANATSASLSPSQTSNNDTRKAQGDLNIHQLVWCKICKVNCTSERSFGTHILGKKHLKNLKASEKATLKPTEHEIGEIVDSEEVKPDGCDTCKVSCSASTLRTHISGKNHMENLQKSMKLPDLPSNPIASVTPLPVGKPKGEVVDLRCELCRVSCSSSEDLNKHLSGQKHRKNIKKSEEIFKRCSAAGKPLEGPVNGVLIPADAEVGGKRKAEGCGGEEDPFGKRQKVVTKEEEECGAYVTCRVCSVVCTTLESFTSHLASHEHSAMVLKQVKVGSK